MMLDYKVLSEGKCPVFTFLPLTFMMNCIPPWCCLCFQVTSVISIRSDSYPRKVEIFLFPETINVDIAAINANLNRPSKTKKEP
jgi:hypothetical protein